MVDARGLRLTLHPGLYSICRLEAHEPVPGWAARASFCSITRTQLELSVVCHEDVVPAQVRAERGWRLLGVQGTLDFKMVGILAGLATALADANISSLAVSTYDTDYLLVRERDVHRSIDALRAAGYEVA